MEYGPVLLAVVGGTWNSTLDSMLLPTAPEVMLPDTWLEPAAGEGALHFKLKQQLVHAIGGADERGAAALRWVPYYEVQEEQMEVYPAMASP
jgi:hypothetical protein